MAFGNTPDVNKTLNKKKYLCGGAETSTLPVSGH